MTPVEAVAAVITAFFGLGIAMGVLIVVALPGRRSPRYQDGGGREEPPRLPEDDEKPPWYGR